MPKVGQQATWLSNGSILCLKRGVMMIKSALVKVHGEQGDE